MEQRMLRRAIAVYAGSSAVAIIGYWCFEFASGSAFQPSRLSIETWVHVGAESLVAIVLLGGAIGLARSRPWGTASAIAGFGMLLYASLNAVGPFAQAGATVMTLLVAGSAVGAAAALLVLASQRD